MTSPKPHRPRLGEIFPGGFDKKYGQSSMFSGSRCHSTTRPDELFRSLVVRNDPNTPTESIIVQSAWYGKQKKGAQHEFIIVQVEDIAIPGLTNYLVLDRSVDHNQGYAGGVALASSRIVPAKDTFRVSYDGKLKKLIEECRLRNYRCLQQLSFPPNQPLRLYELVTLAATVSDRHKHYNLVDSSCYLYAGVIWECMIRMRPSVIRNDDLADERGRHGWFRYAPSDSVIMGAYQEVRERLPKVESIFQKHRQVRIFEAIITNPS